MSFNVSSFVKSLCKISIEHHFNPYVEVCPQHDLPDAPARRTRNLRAYLEALLKIPVSTAWIARDYGYRGGRRTGLPLTDELRFPQFQSLYATAALSKATRTDEVKERTASEVWKLLPPLSPPPLLWNVVPLHPYEPGNPMSNKKHSSAAAEQGLPFLRQLLEHFKPRTILAVGVDSHEALQRLGITNAVYVRHPSYGGQADFKAGVNKYIRLRKNHV